MIRFERRPRPALPLLAALLAAAAWLLPQPAAAGCAQGIVSIGDAPAVVEGDAGTVDALFDVTITPVDHCETEVTFATADGTATAASGDYAQTDGSFTFSPGGPSVVTIAVPVLGDLAVEPDEDFFVIIGSSNGSVEDGEGRAVILNDDFAASLSIDDVSVVEGDSGTTTALFTVTLSEPAAFDVTVAFRNRDGTAKVLAGDYEETSGQLLFQEGQTTQTIPVTVNGDTRVEGDETFRIELSNADGATIADDTGVATILDDDAPAEVGVVRLVDAPPTPEGAGAASVTVERAGDATGAAQVTVVAAAGTATPGSDFVAASQVVSWGAGELGPRTVEVAILDDATEEGDETIAVSLESPVGAVLGTPSSLDLVILDDDQPGGLEQLGDAEIVAQVEGLADLAVRVTRSDGTPVAGARVGWELDGDGVLLEGAATTTDAEGVARQRVQLGDRPGIVTVTATLVATGDTAVFRLTAEGDLQDLFDPAVNPGEASVAGALDQACVVAVGEFAQLCDYLFEQLGEGDQRTVVGEMTPRETAAQGNMSLDAAAYQLRGVGALLAALRGGASRTAVDQLALVIEDELVPLQELRWAVARFEDEEAWAVDRIGHALAAQGESAPATVEAPLEDTSRLGFFLSGRVAFGDRDRTNREEGFEADIVSLTTGLDYRFGDRFVLGGALGYLDTAIDLDAGGGGLDATGYSLTGYWSYFREALYLEGALGYGRNDFELERHIDLPVPFLGQSRLTAVADPDGDQLAASLGLGYDTAFGPASLEGFGRASWVDAAIDGYVETGAGPFDLAIRGQDLESLLSEIGLAWSYAVSYGWGVLQPMLRGAYLHEFEDDSRLIRGRFVGDIQANEFLVPTDEPDRDFFNASVGFTATTVRGRSFFLTYDTDLARDDLDFWAVSLGFRLEL